MESRLTALKRERRKCMCFGCCCSIIILLVVNSVHSISRKGKVVDKPDKFTNFPLGLWVEKFDISNSVVFFFGPSMSSCSQTSNQCKPFGRKYLLDISLNMVSLPLDFLIFIFSYITSFSFIYMFLHSLLVHSAS